MGVSWIDVWGGIVWSPEISGDISLSPNLSETLSGVSFSGSCAADFSSPQEELASIWTPAGPLSLCFGISGTAGASVSGSAPLNGSLTGYVSGQVGSDFHFGFTGAGLNPFDSVSPGVNYPSGSSWGGSLFATVGPYLDGEWGVCGIGGVGVSAGLYDTLSWNASPSGWSIKVKKYVNVSINLNLLDYSYSQTLDNWGLQTTTLRTGSWSQRMEAAVLLGLGDAEAWLRREGG